MVMLGPGSSIVRIRKVSRALCSIVMATAFITAGAGPALASPADPVFFSDVNFEACVRDQLGLPAPAPVTEDDMVTLRALECNAENVADISGVEYASNLTIIELTNNQISTIDPLAALVKLEHVYLSSNQIEDVSALAGLKNISYLTLDNNRLSDVSPLVELKGLVELGLSENQISDAAPLAGLTSVNYLRMANNELSDVSPLASLTEIVDLNLAGNRLSDLSQLTELVNVKSLNVENQVLPAGSAVVGVPQSLPVVLDVSGGVVPVSVVSGEGTVTGDQVVWESVGSGGLVWFQLVTLGGATSAFTVTQEIAVSNEPVSEITFSGSPSNGFVGSEYIYTYQVEGDPAPVVSLTAGMLPEGLMLSADGQISGIPTSAGSYRFTLTASNGSSQDVSLQSVITIAKAAIPPVLGPVLILGFPERNVGQEQTVSGTGFTPGEQVVFRMGQEAVILGHSTVDIGGSVSFKFVVPDGTALGEHQIIAKEAGGRSAVASFMVVDLQTDTRSAALLAVTGGQNALLAAGIAVLLAYAGAILIIRRRRA